MRLAWGLCPSPSHTAPASNPTALDGPSNPFLLEPGLLEAPHPQALDGPLIIVMNPSYHRIIQVRVLQKNKGKNWKQAQ